MKPSILGSMALVSGFFIFLLTCSAAPGFAFCTLVTGLLCKRAMSELEQGSNRRRHRRRRR